VLFLESLRALSARIWAGKTERRLAFVILLIGTAPLAIAIYLSTSLFGQASQVWFNPEIGQELDRSVEIHKEYVRALKDDLKNLTAALALEPALLRAVEQKSAPQITQVLSHLREEHTELVSLSLSIDGQSIASADRGHPVDPSVERSLNVSRPVGDAGALLEATFAVPRAKIDELEASGAVISRYHQMEESRATLYAPYLSAFKALLALTMVFTVVVGALLARGVTRRIGRLARAINFVAQGNLSVRVPVTGSDELTELARTFNRMLSEMEQSRARIEYLQRIGAWQEMAQRLAHEIKNPLTPIQLAVQECHRKYSGDDPRYRDLLNTTLEVVEEEVGSLRRLVGTFSNFARLPHVERVEGNLAEFVNDCRDHLRYLEDTSSEGDPENESLRKVNVQIEWLAPNEELLAAFDKQMLRRVVANLIRNSAQAIRDAGTPGGRVRVSAQRGTDGVNLLIEDNGPGIDPDKRDRIFDPYFTTKSDGTGLGLAIVKKIVVEHGGDIAVSKSVDLGGASFRVQLPSPSALISEKMAAAERAKLREEGVSIP